MGQLLAAVAVDGAGVHAAFPAEEVREYARAGALLAVHIPQVRARDVGKTGEAEGVAVGEHEALGSSHALDKAHAALGEEAAHIALVVAAVALVEQVHARGGELLRRGAGVGRGQGYHKVSPGIQRRAHPHALGQNRHTAALHRAAAHADGNTLCPCGAHGSQLGRMAVVEGVVFGNNACEIHNNWLLILWR